MTSQATEKNPDKNQTKSLIDKTPEHYIHFLIIIFMNICYFYSAFISHSTQLDNFGFNQLHHPGILAIIIFYSLICILAIFAERNTDRIRYINKVVNQFLFKRKTILIAIALLFLSLFLIFKNEFLNYDAKRISAYIEKNVLAKGAYISYDSMLVLFLHSKFWLLTNKAFGWQVILSYQVLSSFAGFMFILILLIFTAKLNPEYPLPLFFLIISGGFMQLFFGDVENYSLVNAVVLLYFLSSYLYIEGKTTLIVPSSILSLSLCFHLLSVWLLPTFIYLLLLSCKRKKYTQILYSLIVFFIIILAAVLFINYTYLKIFPMKNLWLTSNGLRHLIGIYEGTGPPFHTDYDWGFEHYWEVINLLFLLFPYVLIFIPLIIYRRIDLRPFNVFMIWGIVSLSIFLFFWNTTIGVYDDWNLFAVSAIPMTIFCWFNFLRIKNLKYKAAIYCCYLSTSLIHTYSWIISNHFFSG
jgi:hypothetical protein